LDSAAVDESAVSTLIAPGDEMWIADSPEAYFQHGKDALAQIELSIQAAALTKVDRILDLPCGHGRVLRWLRERFEGEIVACDIERSGVDFCADTFGATPVYSDNDPSRVVLPGEFDVIWSGSLVTHLPEWRGFIDLFIRHLRGVLVFTTAGRWIADRMRDGDNYNLPAESVTRLLHDFDNTGFGYFDYPNAVGYGLSRAKPSWVFDLLAEFPLRVVYFGEQGWSGQQDVWACVKQ